MKKSFPIFIAVLRRSHDAARQSMLEMPLSNDDDFGQTGIISNGLTLETNPPNVSLSSAARLICIKRPKAKSMNYFGYIRRRLLGLPSGAVGFEQRGFCGGSQTVCTRLESVGSTFLIGYHLALESSSLPELHAKLAEVDFEMRGFAYEGAAMGLAICESLSPWRARGFLTQKFLTGAGDAHTYMIHVGIGWFWARMPFGFRRAQKKLDPLLGWLAFDGWGFHEGYFHWRNHINGQPVPKKFSGYERRVFDQGFGRSLWFVLGGNVELIAATISNFLPARQPDLWSGIGLAATYAGGVEADALQRLKKLSGQCVPQLAQGSAFAAKARQRAGNLTSYTTLAVKIFCETSAEAAAHVTDAALENLPLDATEPAYEIWRQRIQHHFATNPQTPAAA